ncbi:LysM peptidoglycan-binding domain-containing protein [Bacillus sp. S/N-304-OC-R1]|uniref:LysM peptidoglycan-binding domain-containing protein n=1 Tax=Bacillus sp. S/N-304-OC-R1 TaxID=2758034 RepID=UPI001C8D52D5|nr:LysM peptidoglycan-binding domain-containing protein [Bacillus sp. S/N-304-OC-R1]MBY0122149.1 LysM peptidoglycan-binding domain-containing protein [Bacillus sp. S/N-304-OC-R1]
MAYNFFIDSVQLPVAPSSLDTKIRNKNTTITLINEGEVNLLKKAGLTELSFDLLLPNSKYPFAVYPDGFQPATYYLDKLEKLKIDNKPFQFIVSRLKPSGDLLFDTNMKVSLEEYTIKENADYGFDVVVSIQLKQYRDYGTKVIEVKKPSASAAANVKPIAKTTQPRATTSAPPPPQSHKVVKGDTLWALCKSYLGDGSKYPEIAKKNNIKNPNLIYPGQVIKF